MKFSDCDQYISTALNEAKKSMMTHMHGCISIDNKTGQILSRGFNDWCSWSDMPCSRRAPSEWQWQQRQKEKCQESPC